MSYEAREALSALCGASCAAELLELYGSPQAVVMAGRDELRRTAGEAATARLMAAVRLGELLGEAAALAGAALSSPAETARFLMAAGAHLRPVEEFGVLALNVRHRLIGRRLVSTGCLTASLVHPREVFKVAIDLRAAALVLYHNHPSGDPEPSSEDIALTRRLAAAGTLMGVEVLDHLVLGGGRFVSLKERGVL